jgi:hypothetical protein
MTLLEDEGPMSHIPAMQTGRSKMPHDGEIHQHGLEDHQRFLP